MKHKLAVWIFVVLCFLSASLRAETNCCEEAFMKASKTPDFTQAHPLLKVSNPPELKGHMVAMSDFGSEDLAYLSLPDTPPKGGVVLIHEWWGLNDQIKLWADKLAAEGFVTVAVDLYNGQVATDPTQASQLMQGVRESSALKTIRAGARLLKESPKFKVNTVATWGWCFGGGYSFKAAHDIREVDAAVVFYGPPKNDPEWIAHLNVPICGIFATRDQWVTPAMVDQFEQQMKAQNKDLEIHRFDAEHAFANPSNAKYDAPHAEEAWKIAIDFLTRQLSKPPRPGPNFFQKLLDKKDVM